MARKIIYTESAPDPIGPYSQAVLINGMLFISGQIALDSFSGALMINDGIEAETKQVMENLLAILEAAEMDFSNVVKSSIFLSDMGSFPKVNEVYGRYFKENPPARETVEVSCLPRKVNVEISMIAMR
jgi:2-iminobutanoate/2-iminopropanoate deaminase